MIIAAIIAAVIAVGVASYQKTKWRVRMPWETDETHHRLGGS